MLLFECDKLYHSCIFLYSGLYVEAVPWSHKCIQPTYEVCKCGSCMEANAVLGGGGVLTLQILKQKLQLCYKHSVHYGLNDVTMVMELISGIIHLIKH